MVIAKDYRIIEPKRNSTIAKLSGIYHKIIRFFQSVLPAYRTWSILKTIRPETSNVIHML